MLTNKTTNLLFQFMLSKNEINYIKQLTTKKQLVSGNLFIAEGPKLAEELLNSEYTIAKIYATDGWIKSQTKKLTKVFEITEQELQQISQLTAPNQVLVIVEENKLPAFAPKPNTLTLALNDIQDPGNLGTIIRIADWFGIQNIVCSPSCANYKNPKVIQSSMGSFLRVNVYYENLLEIFQQHPLPIYGALLNGKNVFQNQPTKNGFLLIGNESKGISKELLSFVTQPISIPKLGGAESLNAAVACGILVSHFGE